MELKTSLLLNKMPGYQNTYTHTHTHTHKNKFLIKLYTFKIQGDISLLDYETNHSVVKQIEPQCSKPSSCVQTTDRDQQWGVYVLNDSHRNLRAKRILQG